MAKVESYNNRVTDSHFHRPLTTPSPPAICRSYRALAFLFLIYFLRWLSSFIWSLLISFLSFYYFLSFPFCFPSSVRPPFLLLPSSPLLSSLLICLGSKFMDIINFIFSLYTQITYVGAHCLPNVMPPFPLSSSCVVVDAIFHPRRHRRRL